MKPSPKQSSPPITQDGLGRRGVIKGAAGLVVAGLAAAEVGNAAPPDVKKRKPKAIGVKKGRINQSVVSWCFSKYWSTEEMCGVAKKLGCKSIELIAPEEWPTLKKHGFRPVGPLVVEVGKWSEVTYLFLFKSLEEREQLRFAFQSHPDSQIYGGRLGALVSDLTTRVLVPSPLMLPMGQARVDGLNPDQFPTDAAGVLGSDRSENRVFNIDKMDLWPSLVHVRSRADEDRAFPILLKNSKPWNRPYRAVPGLFRFNR